VGSGSKGGAIYVSDGIIEIDECEFRNNSAMGERSEGGALAMERETVMITNSLFQKNNVEFNGNSSPALFISPFSNSGVIRIISDTSVTIDNCIFLENSGDFNAQYPDSTPGVITIYWIHEL